MASVLYCLLCATAALAMVLMFTISVIPPFILISDESCGTEMQLGVWRVCVKITNELGVTAKVCGTYSAANSTPGGIKVAEAFHCLAMITFGFAMATSLIIQRMHVPRWVYFAPQVFVFMSAVLMALMTGCMVHVGRKFRSPVYEVHASTGLVIACISGVLAITYGVLAHIIHTRSRREDYLPIQAE
eukprot:scpid74974/ scgid29531/ 